MSRTQKISEGVLNENHFKTKKDGYEKDCYVTDIKFDEFGTELIFSPNPETITKTDGSTVEFPGAIVIYNSEKPAYLYKSERKANAFRKVAVPTNGMNGRLKSIKNEDETYTTMYSIQFDKIPTESKIQQWKYVISRNDEAYDEYKRRKASETTTEVASDEEDGTTPF